jgi:hypothetical protein
MMVGVACKAGGLPLTKQTISPQAIARNSVENREENDCIVYHQL